MAFVFSGCTPSRRLSLSPWFLQGRSSHPREQNTDSRNGISQGCVGFWGDLGGVLYVLLAGGMEDYGRIWYLCEFQRHYIMTLTYAHAICVMVPFNYNRGNSQPKVASLMSWEILSNKWEVSSNMSTSAGTLRRIVEINILLPSTNRTPTGSSRPSWVRC